MLHELLAVLYRPAEGVSKDGDTGRLALMSLENIALKQDVYDGVKLLSVGGYSTVQYSTV